MATEDQLRENLFGAHSAAEVLLGEERGEPVSFALFFHNFSTWLGRRGLYLEDLFVRPEMRGKGYGRALLARLAQIAQERDCGRMEWAVLDWNEPAIQFYRKLGARPNDEWTIFRLTSDGIVDSPGKLEEAAAVPSARRRLGPAKNFPGAIARGKILRLK